MLAANGYPDPSHTARQLEQEDIGGDVLRLTMEDRQKSQIWETFENAPHVFTLREYAGESGDVISVKFARKNLMHMKLLERKAKLFEDKLAQAYGRPMRISMSLEGAQAKASGAAASAAKSVIEQSYDIFGRENIEITD